MALALQRSKKRMSQASIFQSCSCRASRVSLYGHMDQDSLAVNHNTLAVVSGLSIEPCAQVSNTLLNLRSPASGLLERSLIRCSETQKPLTIGERRARVARHRKNELQLIPSGHRVAFQTARRTEMRIAQSASAESTYQTTCVAAWNCSIIVPPFH